MLRLHPDANDEKMTTMMGGKILMLYAPFQQRTYGWREVVSVNVADRSGWSGIGGAGGRLQRISTGTV